MVLTTIASAALGLFGSALPEITTYFKDRSDQKHKLEILKFQATSEHATALVAKDQAYSEALAEEMKAIYRDANTGKSWRWVDAIYKLTRPGITLAIVAQWVLVNIAEMVWIVQTAGQWTAVTQAWSEFDQSMMTAVVMFWFGHRAMMRTHGRTHHN